MCVLFRSILLLYSAGSGVNRVQVILSGFSVRLFCFVQTKIWLYVFLGCTRAFFCLFSRRFFNRQKTDISNTVRKRGEKPKRKLLQR